MTIFKLKNIIFCQRDKSLNVNKITWSKFREKLNRLFNLHKIFSKYILIYILNLEKEKYDFLIRYIIRKKSSQI